MMYVGVLLGKYRGCIRIMGNYYVIIGYILGYNIGLYWDNGKENGNYDFAFYMQFYMRSLHRNQKKAASSIPSPP